MDQKQIFWLPVSAVLLMAADPPWKSKSIAQWNEDDAKQVLTSSPWVKTVMAAILPPLSEDQRREGGATGGGKDVIPAAIGNFLGVTERAKQSKEAGSAKSGDFYKLAVRWESALPVRVAELKAREFGAPDWEGDDYVVAVYDVPLQIASHQKKIVEELKRTAALKRDRKKDLKPSSVELLLRANGLVIVLYRFPRSQEFTQDDGHISFEAKVDRLVLTSSFEIEEMHFQGKIEL